MNMERDIEPFIKLVFPTSLLGDKNLTPLERLLLIYILSLIQENLNTSIQENFKQYNKNNNIRKNIGPAIEYDDEGNIISWNGKSTVSEPMSEEEIKEL